ncbi:MAG: phosphate acyltransferase [Myxococcota bacterium]|jgi:phosphate butyryltransferase|nr:phosphate butyryltransferase [Myxococcota bacterium]HHW96812.1 phosphate butyryltransferase [Oligoflexales bacterium]HQL57655.1 phosphate acyltransferase [Myxococcota bacterium]
MTARNMTDQDFLEGARKSPKRIVVPSAANQEALEAISMAFTNGALKKATLIGDPTAIAAKAKAINLDINKCEIIECYDDDDAATLAVSHVVGGHGDFLLKGQLDTKKYLKAVLNKSAGIVEAGRILSHVTVTSIPTYPKPLLFTDVAINIAPDVETKIQIVKNAIEVATKLGIERPKVALVAAVEKVNPKIVSTTDAAAVVEAAKQGAFPQAAVEGPYDLYIATSKEAAEIKGVQGEVCGDADILVFPALDAGNVFYKTIQRFVPGCWNAGVVAGAKIPVLLPSRADDAKSKLMSILVAAWIASNS